MNHPKLGSALNDLIARVEAGEVSAEDAAAEAPLHRGESVAVTLYLSGNVDGVVRFLEDNGVSPRNVGEDYIEAFIPILLLPQISEQPGILRVEAVIPAESFQGATGIAGNGPVAHSSPAWNQAGYTGQGIKVGIIDGGFEHFSGLMGKELPRSVRARCYPGDSDTPTNRITDCARGGAHGTVVAESVMDIAPDVSLYIANVQFKGDMQAAVTWMIQQDVDVINHSMGWFFDGPGDGTSLLNDSPLRSVDRAVDSGIVWVNAAGNYAQKTWFGSPSDADGNGAIEFATDDEKYDFDLYGGDLKVQLRWDDSWSGAVRDLDLYIYDRANNSVLRRSENSQSGSSGETPFESIYAEGSGRVYARVVNRSSSMPSWIQLTLWGSIEVEHYTENGSIVNPAESANPGMLAVGAAHWDDVNSIESYSSRGPTPDGRVKPDIVGADCGQTATWDSFCGTSQAAPHVAGMAALVRQRFPNYTPAQVVSYLKENAQQRISSPDPSNTWGHGFLVLPPTQDTSPCATDGAVTDAANNPGLVSDCETLLALKDTLRGTATLNWSGSTSIASWDGITVSGTPLRVTQLSLSRNRDTGRLSGTIPPELSALTGLTVLKLSENRLTGTIPPELGALPNLSDLNLWDNQLTGSIPAKLGDLENLRFLILKNNQLSGKIPPDLGKLDELRTLALGFNDLTGLIPSELGGLANLTELSLSHNQLTGEIPPELGRLSNLTELGLLDNRLTGEIPSELGGLSNLTGLWLNDNQLTGGIPSELGRLSNLKFLYLYNNRLTGEIPSELGGLSNLEWLFLGPNQLRGCIPEGLGDIRFNDLEELNLPVCAAATHEGDRAALVALYNSTGGARWTQNRNWLSGRPIGEWHGVTTDSNGRVTRLVLFANRLTGEIPPELGGLSNLKELSLYSNQLTGEIPPELGGLSNLKELSLSSNQLTGEIPPELGGLSNLTFLSLYSNQLTGEIPPELGGLSNLTGAGSPPNNQLTGEIPPELGGLSNLICLSTPTS